jgi:hypothetical protein
VYRLLAHGYDDSHFALESRVITGYVAVASAVVILLQGAHHLAKAHRSGRVNAATSANYVESHGGWTILIFQLLRLLANDALFSMAIYTSVLSDWSTLGNNVVVFSSVSVSIFSLPRTSS